MADYPLEELDGKTPLQAAETPNIDWVASNGKTGRLKNVPDGMESGSDVAIMSILGYDPKENYTGRGPLEAEGIGVDLGEDDFAFRCNLITVKDGRIDDYSGGHVTTKESEKLLKAISEKYGELGEFYPGVDYRHVFVVRNRGEELEGVSSYAPHQNVGGKIEDLLLKPDSWGIVQEINDMVLNSSKILSKHEVNERRVENGDKPANYIWIWSGGKNPSMKPFKDKFGVKGAVISAVKLVDGLGSMVGMDKIDVPDITGYYDTSYHNKAVYGIEALEDHDLVIIHVEAPDTAGHEGDLDNKIKSIERIDERIVGKIREELEGTDYSLSVMADHPTPIPERDHTKEPVPLAVYSSDGEKDKVEVYDENSVRKGNIGTIPGHEFMKTLLS